MTAQALDWRCFHCGDVFTDPHAAAQHFGIDEGKTPACKIKGSEHGLIKALRDAEAEADEAIQLMHSESTDAAKAYHRQRTRHAQAMIAAEETGYARGLRDARAEFAQTLALGERDWAACWYGSDPMKGSHIHTVTEHGSYGEMVAFVGATEEHHAQADKIVAAHNAFLARNRAAAPTAKVEERDHA